MRLVCLMFLIFLNALSQTNSALDDVKIQTGNETGVFSRKSLTILPLASSSFANYHKNLLEGMSVLLPSGRFDNNYIKESTILNAQKLFLKENFDFVNFNSESNSKIIFNILKSSGALAEIIATTANMDSLIKRVERSKKRVVTSALEQMKIAKLTVNDAKNLINNTFIALPILNKVEQRDKSFYSIGAYLWFRIDISKVSDWQDGKPSIEQTEIFLINSKTTSISSFDADILTSAFTKEDKSPDDIKSVKNFTKSIVNMALTMNEFAVRATVQDVNDGIRIDIGKREGVYLDQGYKVYELRLNNENKVSSEYMGFIRVNDVADNEIKIDALSRAYTIIPGGFEAGHILVSHDQSFDFIIKGQYRTLFIPKEFGTNLITSNSIYKEDVLNSYNVEAAFAFNIARLINSTQFFLGVSGAVGLPASSPKDITGFTATTPLTYEANIFLKKKFWIPYIAFYIQAEAGAKTLALTGKYKVLNVEEEWEINTGWNLSAGGTVGLEFAASPDLIIGLEAGYNYVFAPTELKYKLGKNEFTYKKDDNSTIWKDNKFDDFQLGGLKAGLKVSISLPPIF